MAYVNRCRLNRIITLERGDRHMERKSATRGRILLANPLEEIADFWPRWEIDVILTGR
jgi:hypothetical protein